MQIARRTLFYSISLLAALLFLSGCENSDDEAISWKMEDLKAVGGYSTAVWGDPRLSEDKGKLNIVFDGKKDGLLVDNNPIAGMEEFTIEVDFKPFKAYPENIEQRFLHIQDPGNPNRRILLELRLNNQDQWYGDWYIKAGNYELALIDSTNTHPVNEWAKISLVYKSGKLKGYINGKLEATGEIEYLPIGVEGKTSIGTRMDKRSWFKGAIREVRFIPEAADL